MNYLETQVENFQVRVALDNGTARQVGHNQFMVGYSAQVTDTDVGETRLVSGELDADAADMPGTLEDLAQSAVDEILG